MKSAPQRLLISKHRAKVNQPTSICQYPISNIPPLPFFTLNPIIVVCPCICTTTTITYSHFFFFFFFFFKPSVPIRHTRGSLRVFAGRTNALLFTPKIQLIDPGLGLFTLCNFTLFIRCPSFTEVSSPAVSSSTKAQASFPHFPSSSSFTSSTSSTSTLYHNRSTSPPAPPCFLT